MDDFIGRKNLIPPERLRQLTLRSDWQGARQTLSHFGALGVTGCGLYLSWGSGWAVPLFILHGMLLNYLFAAQHEFNHYTAFRTRWINDVCNRITGFLVLYPRDYERWFHFEHHHHTQNWRRDPELLTRERYRLGNYLLYLLGISYWYSRIQRLVVQAAGQVEGSYLSEAQRQQVAREACVHVLAYGGLAAASLLLQSGVLVQLWIAPLLLTKVLHQVQNITEHTALTHHPDVVHNTRTIKTWPVLRWMAWNMQYHTAHHTYPAVPFHKLPALHAEMVARLGYQPPTIGYLAFQYHFIRHLLHAPEPLEGLDTSANGESSASSKRR